MFDVCNNFTINAGSPGVDIQTSGRFNVMSGDMILNANEGEAVFGSGNVTTIKGKNIILDANDGTGDTGIAIQSANTMVHGSFNVRGDAAFKGHLTTDGAISTPFLIVPSMRTESSGGSSSKFKTEGANWIGVAEALAASNLAKDLIFRYLMTGYIMTIGGMYALAAEVYDLIMTGITIEPEPTGICIGYGVGVVFNFKHNHTLVGGDHSHSVTSPKASYWNTRKAWGQERTAGSSVPTPSPVNGDTPSPGPKSKPGGCGGGGLYTKTRNETYNVNINDAFNQTNYISVPIKRNYDGTLIPTPQYSMIYGLSGVNTTGTGVTIPSTVDYNNNLNC